MFQNASFMKKENGKIAENLKNMSLKDPTLREYIRLRAAAQKTKKKLFEKQLDLKIRCEFLKFPDPDDSIDIGIKEEKEHPMVQFRQMENEFKKKHET